VISPDTATQQRVFVVIDASLQKGIGYDIKTWCRSELCDHGVELRWDYRHVATKWEFIIFNDADAMFFKLHWSDYIGAEV
jgi:hypothetical protein